jgi:hypothetical protein
MIRQADDIRDCFGITFPDAKLMENYSVVHALKSAKYYFDVLKTNF